MGQLGRSRGKAFMWHPVALEFARHYGFALKACDGGDAKRKGKIERPFRDLKAGFLAEMDLDPPADIGELNRRAETWLARYAHAVGAPDHQGPPRGAVPHRAAAAHPVAAGAFRHRPPRTAPSRSGADDRVGRRVLLGAARGRRPDDRGPPTGGVVGVGAAFRRAPRRHPPIVAAGSEPQWLPEHRAAARSDRARPSRPSPAPRRRPRRRAVWSGSISAPATTTSTNPTSTYSRRSARTLTSTWVWTTPHTATWSDGFEGCGCFGGLR